MGGGNAQKSKTKRERNNLKKAKDAKQQNHDVTRAKVKADCEAIKCKICMTTFMITAKPVQLQEHFDAKHASKGIAITDCFPHLA